MFAGQAHRSLMPALGRSRQKDHKFKLIIGYINSSSSLATELIKSQSRMLRYSYSTKKDQ